MKVFRRAFLLLSLLFLATAHAFAQDGSFTKDCRFQVLASKFDAKMVFSYEKQGDSLSVTMAPYSETGEDMGKLTFSAQLQDDGTYWSKKQTVTAYGGGKEVKVTVSSLKSNLAAGSVSMKMKMGKMPFEISLSTK